MHRLTAQEHRVHIRDRGELCAYSEAHYHALTCRHIHTHVMIHHSSKNEHGEDQIERIAKPIIHM